MTHLVRGYKTKKDFIKAVKEKPEEVELIDPSIFNPREGSVRDLLTSKPDEMLFVTNERRSWFANIKLSSTGIKVG
jgi:hypothetical protein